MMDRADRPTITEVTARVQGVMDGLIKDAGFYLVLTGSRRFGHPNANSDWDYFCDERTGHKIFALTRWLPTGEQQLFRQTGPGGAYRDSNCLFVLRHYELPIDIQVQKDLAVKEMASDRMVKLMPFIIEGLGGFYPSKKQWPSLWETQYTLARLKLAERQ